MLSPDLFRREMSRMALALDASPQQPEPSDERIAQLYDDVKHLDDVSFVLSCERCRRELDWFPKARHIIERAQQVRQGLGDTTSALDAWGEFRRTVTLRLNLDLLARSPEAEMTRVGLTPLDAQIARRLGGFKHLIDMTPRDMDFKAKEFQAVYDELSANRRTEDQLIALEPAQPQRIPLLAEGDGYDR